MKQSTISKPDRASITEPVTPSTHNETQEFSHVRRMPIALDAGAARASVDNVNQILADTVTLAALYRKHHWQVAAPAFYSLHLLFDKHFREQDAIVDTLAERVESLGGVSLAMGADVAETTLIPAAPKGREDSATQIMRLIQAHEVILLEARAMARAASESGDFATNDIIVSNVIRTGELQVWFLMQHVHI